MNIAPSHHSATLNPTNDPLSTEETLPLFLLSLSYGFYFFLLLLLPFKNMSLTRDTLWIIFIAGWMLVFPLALLSSVAVRRLVRNLFNEFNLAYAFLLLINILFVTSSI